ncbi:hypothetical protein QR680_007023 [Steinernema hermaphroditum]|uniref:Uncharacterized protein n=1 Tax=Steinernema hermaphroditum TaxID=289476 RepID=A0AA39HZV2_9BILA|nr:hypothetical protein QR680_007023 [Steinernema hermaphroditum]
MNTCSLFFYHEVIGHFRKKDIEKLKYLKGFWSSIAAAHYEKRRDLTVHLAPNTYYQRCNVELEVLCDNVPVRFEIDPAYDRVRTIAVGGPERHRRGAVLETILATICKVAAACYLTVNVDATEEFWDPLFDGLRQCAGLSEISLSNYGVKACQFIKEQIDLGAVKALDLSYERQWPTDLQGCLSSFVKSSSFTKLTIAGSNLTLDIEMVSCFLDRFFKGELKKGAGLFGVPSFHWNKILKLFPNGTSSRGRWPKTHRSVHWTSPVYRRKLEMFRDSYRSISLSVCQLK